MSPTSDETFHVSWAIQERDDPTHKRDRNRDQNDRRIEKRLQREIQQQDDDEQGRPAIAVVNERAGTRLLHAPSDAEEVAGR